VQPALKEQLAQEQVLLEQREQLAQQERRDLPVRLVRKVTLARKEPQ
jgi:predicted dithiol-disulfide oxidoreductase (DUF899 family)